MKLEDITQYAATLEYHFQTDDLRRNGKLQLFRDCVRILGLKLHENLAAFEFTITEPATSKRVSWSFTKDTRELDHSEVGIWELALAYLRSKGWYYSFGGYNVYDPVPYIMISHRQTDVHFYAQHRDLALACCLALVQADLYEQHILPQDIAGAVYGRRR